MIRKIVIAWFVVLSAGLTAFAQSPAQSYKAQLVKDVDGMAKETQVMVDTVFSFGELGFQEFETSKYLTRSVQS